MDSDTNFVTKSFIMGWVGKVISGKLLIISNHIHEIGIIDWNLLALHVLKNLTNSIGSILSRNKPSLSSPFRIQIIVPVDDFPPLRSV